MRVRKLAFVFVVVATAGVVPGLRPRDAEANNWPPAKGADMTDPSNWPNDPGYNGDWNYWSWLPKQSGAVSPLLGADQKLGASGMHIDVGWTYTTGRPDVKIAIIDCGIKWDESDLADKAWLNAKELAGAHMPQTAAGAACGGSGELAGYDCNGDGVFSVSDYAADPRVAPLVTDPADVCYPGANPDNKGQARMTGDLNKNCILDAGDLIALFSDGVDDDVNGYKDDISGWDFYKNDNDPYDDTRYGHGTGEGRMSSDQGNNGMGDIGVCPDCRFMMLRAGDSFIVDVNDWAKGVVYAADNGVKVVQEALGTIDQTTFSKAAIDYAYGKGTLIVASMADENSRHHNLPAAYNHVLTVHSMKHDGDINGSGANITTTATTFLNYDTCSDYGGQQGLSISATSCSSEATGRAAGIAGLLVSEGLNQSLQLDPEEVLQLMKMTADVVDVPDSTSSNPDVANQFFESLPYFSQRFGYGRPNVDSAMKAIDAGLIPPEVDLTSPGWFDVLYADRTTGPVPIVGSVSAKRAQSFDYRIEWAPGVEPADEDFQPIVDWVNNVPPTTAVGGASSDPLGMIAPGQINTAHTPDPDSAKFHENDRTITLRVLATAHYATGDAHGEARRTVAIVNAQNGLDTDLAPGFPLAMGASLESSPKLADIDGDGVRDIVAAGADGSLHVFSLASGLPVELPGFPFHTNRLDGLNPDLTSEPSVPSYLSAPAYKAGASGGIDPDIARESIVATPAIGDVNGDGKPEIVVTSWQGTVYVVAHDGTALPGWPIRLPLVPSCPFDLPSTTATTTPCMDTGHLWSRGAYASPVLADFDHDGTLEVVQAAFDGNIYAWHGDGTPLDGWPVLLHGTHANSYNRIMSTPAVADFNGDGVPDLVSGSNEEVGAGGGAGLAFLVDGRGMKTSGGPYLPNWPIGLTSFDIFPLIAEGLNYAPAIADFEGTGQPQALITGNGVSPYLFPADPGVQSGFNVPPNIGPCYDETPDAGGGGGQVPCSTPGAQVGIDPTSIFGAGSKAKQPDSMFPLFSSPSIGDLDQDGVPDYVTSGGSLSVLGNTTGGATPAHPPQYLLGMWSGRTGHPFYGSPVPIEDYTLLVSHAVADITGDNYPEVMLGTGGYFVHAVDACGCEAPAWPKFTDGWIVATPAVGDVDGDHKLDVVVGTREGNLFAWHTQGTDTGVVEWESYHHDNANTGNYATPLTQGVLERAAGPIDCATDCTASTAVPVTQKLKPGGCGCGTVGADEAREGAFAGLLAGLGVVLVRRRRSRRQA